MRRITGALPAPGSPLASRLYPTHGRRAGLAAVRFHVVGEKLLVGDGHNAGYQAANCAEHTASGDTVFWVGDGAGDFNLESN